MVEVILENLTKYFGNVRAVENLNLKIRDKEFLTLLGPSGCGKTTTMRLIAGLETPTKGNIYIGDRLVNDLPPKDRDVAMVFQSYALYPHMTVRDNLAFPLKMRKYPKQEIEERVKRVSELLQISELLDRKPKQLSGGQQQRVALGRAIVREPKVFLMDEPLSNLDAKLRVYMRAELKGLQKRLGITTIYVTHDQIEAMTMSDRIALLNAGILQQLGTPEEIYEKPANLFVAGFVGSPPMNFFETSYVEKNGNVYLDSGSFQYNVTEFKDILSKFSGSKFVLGVRPEHITFDKQKKSEDSIEGEIFVTEPLGAETIVDVKVGDNIVRVRVPYTVYHQIGEKVWLTFDRQKIHIFDSNEKLII
ncbi:Trehalose import ATP-binding protein SugC [archaeon HR06]|nr:Trehalose import ATP-binding protein SugC [archaeon HR06]